MSSVPKYRAWYKPLGVMIQPENLVMINFDTKVLGVYMEMDGKGYHVLRMSDFELMEYTGLKDKNKREIYAGDIPRDPTGIGEIEWVQEHCAYMVFTKNPSKYHHLESDGKLLQTEIIGNIYENPELIEV
ncbi:YopX family protein [Paenibacillus sp. FSL R5-0928]|uniref:YopX family protein n=1 Tax=Paenibacillus sp. FSL R5-0928 TaxID=2921667 RepID=UPI0030DAD85F